MLPNAWGIPRDELSCLDYGSKHGAFPEIELLRASPEMSCLDELARGQAQYSEAFPLPAFQRTRGSNFTVSASLFWAISASCRGTLPNESLTPPNFAEACSRKRLAVPQHVSPWGLAAASMSEHCWSVM